MSIGIVLTSTIILEQLVCIRMIGPVQIAILMLQEDLLFLILV